MFDAPSDKLGITSVCEELKDGGDEMRTGSRSPVSRYCSKQLFVTICIHIMHFKC